MSQEDKKFLVCGKTTVIIDKKNKIIYSSLGD